MDPAWDSFSHLMAVGHTEAFGTPWKKSFGGGSHRGTDLEYGGGRETQPKVSNTVAMRPTYPTVVGTTFVTRGPGPHQSCSSPARSGACPAAPRQWRQQEVPSHPSSPTY